MKAKDTKSLDKQHIIRGWTVNEKTDPLVVNRAEGMYFWDADGNRYLEFSSALVNLNLGHQHPKVVSSPRHGSGGSAACFMASRTRLKIELSS